MKYLLLFFGLLLLSGCSPKLKRAYGRLSASEKNWVVFHPFKAKEAYYVSKEVEVLIDSIAHVGIIGNDNNGGLLDAFKHSLWMARLTQNIGKNAAKKLGDAHEKGNYKAFKKRQLEDGIMPDKLSSEMDIYNNSIGIKVGDKFKKATHSLLIDKLIDSLYKGKLKILKKDSLGNFLDCHNHILNENKANWYANKCLQPSYFNILLR